MLADFVDSCSSGGIVYPTRYETVNLTCADIERSKEEKKNVIDKLSACISISNSIIVSAMQGSYKNGTGEGISSSANP